MGTSEHNQKIIDKLYTMDMMNYDNLSMLFDMAKEVLKEDLMHGLEIAQDVKKRSSKLITVDSRMYGLYNNCLLLRSPYKFDDYMLYVEKDRAPEKQFYLPRRKVLKTVVDDLQDLEDGKLDFYGLSMPPRVGKSTICIFFLSWVMGKRPNSHNAMSGHSGILADGFYDEAMNIIISQEYNWGDVFPGIRLESKSSEKKEINLDKPDRFSTLTCRGIDGTWTGAVDISNDGYLYVDDLVRDRTESLSPIRLEGRYQDYLNILVDRKNDGTRELMVGTRWNVLDPLGKVEKQYKDNPRYRFRKIPALNENGESNFDYLYGKGFSTQYYVNLKERLDKNEWEAKYQQRPFTREGLLFEESTLNFYNGTLPSDGLMRVVAVCDVAWGGGDSLSMPFAYVYDDGRVFIHDWIFNKGDKKVTKPIVVGKSLYHKPNQEHFEANNGGDEYADDIDRQLKENGFKTNITYSKASNQTTKLAKIIQCAPDIKANFYFLDEKHRDKEYQDAMDELTMFVQIGKNEHDDATDALSQLQNFINGGFIAKVTAMQRPF